MFVKKIKIGNVELKNNRLYNLYIVNDYEKISYMNAIGYYFLYICNFL